VVSSAAAVGWLVVTLLGRHPFSPGVGHAFDEASLGTRNSTIIGIAASVAPAI
jgi:hypothetical protein